MRARRLAGLVAVLGLCVALVAPNAGAASLSSARARLDSLLTQIKSARAQQAKVQAQLDALASKIANVQTQMAETQAQITSTQGAIQAAQGAIASQQNALNTRARMAYEEGPGSTLEFVLGATSAADLNDRLELLDAAAQSDEEIINALTDQKNKLHVQQVHLQQQQDQLGEQEAGLQKQQDALSAKFETQKTLVDGISSKIKQAQSLVHRLKLQTQIPVLSPGGGSHGPAIPGVLLTCPVDGPHAYVDDFGAPRPGHIHEGIDIQAAEGTPIVAPFPGRVVQSYDPGGGNDVFVYGALGYAFNAHLSAYGATGNVKTGTVIGYVGATGDATGPHDHFEWHPKVIPPHPWTSPYGYSQVGTAIDAYPYLNSVC
ncbi:MAG TPA: peptidoglycan DD-metalloendopeptidase family protein [Actinomycetota bacterium]|nr:peptidoglycan DD-metalloendopeptidase family protein [Actinomycetota bacterium]